MSVTVKDRAGRRNGMGRKIERHGMGRKIEKIGKLISSSYILETKKMENLIEV